MFNEHYARDVRVRAQSGTYTNQRRGKKVHVRWVTNSQEQLPTTSRQLTNYVLIIHDKTLEKNRNIRCNSSRFVSAGARTCGPETKTVQW